MKINYDRIISVRISEQVPETELIDIRAEAMEARKRIFRDYTKIRIAASNNIGIRAYKEVYETGIYKQKSEHYKALIATNIVFYNNEKFADILLDNQRFYPNRDIKDILDSAIKLATFVKKESEHKEISNEALIKKCHKAVEIFITKLMPTLEKEYGEVRPEIIINKVIEIVSFYPELLETRKTTKTR